MASVLSIFLDISSPVLLWSGLPKGSRGGEARSSHFTFATPRPERWKNSVPNDPSSLLASAEARGGAGGQLVFGQSRTVVFSSAGRRSGPRKHRGRRLAGSGPGHAERGSVGRGGYGGRAAATLDLRRASGRR